MQYRRCGCALLTMSSLMAVTFTAFAETTSRTEAKGRSIRQESDEGSEPGRVEFDFPGGSCASYVALLEELFPEQAVVLGPGVADFELPAVRLAVDSVRPALRLACGLEGELVYTTGDRPRAAGVLELESITPDIWRIVGRPDVDVRVSRRSAPDRAHSRTFKAQSVGRLVDSGVSIEEIREALELAFSLTDPGAPPMLYQESTMILFMHGTDLQLAVFEDTLWELGVASQARGKAVREKAGDDRKEPDRERRQGRRPPGPDGGQGQTPQLPSSRVRSAPSTMPSPFRSPSHPSPSPPSSSLPS